MAKEVPAFLPTEIGNGATDPTQEPQNRSRRERPTGLFLLI
jgi:hypothetical protein